MLKGRACWQPFGWAQKSCNAGWNTFLTDFSGNMMRSSVHEPRVQSKFVCVINSSQLLFAELIFAINIRIRLCRSRTEDILDELLWNTKKWTFWICWKTVSFVFAFQPACCSSHFHHKSCLIPHCWTSVALYHSNARKWHRLHKRSSSSFRSFSHSPWQMLNAFGSHHHQV